MLTEGQHSDDSNADALRALAWLVEMGADECIADQSVDRLAAPQPIAPETSSPRSPKMPRQETPGGAHAVRPATLDVMKERDASEARAAAAKAETLEDLERILRDFDAGHIKRAAKSTVFAAGPDDAPLLLIGEAPGADEDRQGLPFVGRSGQLLDRMLAAVGWSREENVRITNLVPWRPLGNKTPDQAVVSLCLPFLIRQVELVNPKLIICLGATPARALLGVDTGITRLRGRMQEADIGTWHGPVMAMYHPAYLLRQPHFKREAWLDIQKARETLLGLT